MYVSIGCQCFLCDVMGRYFNIHVFCGNSPPSDNVGIVFNFVNFANKSVSYVCTKSYQLYVLIKQYLWIYALDIYKSP